MNEIHMENRVEYLGHFFYIHLDQHEDSLKYTLNRQVAWFTKGEITITDNWGENSRTIATQNLKTFRLSDKCLRIKVNGEADERQLICDEELYSIIVDFCLNEEDKKRLYKLPMIPKSISKYIISALALIVMLIIIGLATKPSNNRWDALSDDEKEWYERNYGGGKSDAIDKAIEDYMNR